MAPVREWDDPTNSGLRPNAKREQTRPRTRSKSPGPLRLRKAKQGEKRETRRTMEYDYIGINRICAGSDDGGVAPVCKTGPSG